MTRGRHVMCGYHLFYAVPVELAKACRRDILPLPVNSPSLSAATGTRAVRGVILSSGN